MKNNMLTSDAFQKVKNLVSHRASTILALAHILLDWPTFLQSVGQLAHDSKISYRAPFTVFDAETVMYRIPSTSMLGIVCFTPFSCNNVGESGVPGFLQMVAT